MPAGPVISIFSPFIVCSTANRCLSLRVSCMVSFVVSLRVSITNNIMYYVLCNKNNKYIISIFNSLDWQDIHYNSLVINLVITLFFLL